MVKRNVINSAVASKLTPAAFRAAATALRAAKAKAFALPGGNAAYLAAYAKAAAKFTATTGLRAPGPNANYFPSYGSPFN